MVHNFVIYLTFLFCVRSSQALRCYFKIAASPKFDMGECPSNTNECFTARCRSQVDGNRVGVLAGCFTRNFATIFQPMFQRHHACDPPHFCSYDGCNSSGKQKHRAENNAVGAKNGGKFQIIGLLIFSLATTMIFFV